MTGKGKMPNRDTSLRRAIMAGALLCGGLLGGALLGRIAVGENLRADIDRERDFASLSSNPDAVVADPVPLLTPCTDCADSYGVAARMQAMRDRDDDAIRALGEVNEAGYDTQLPAGAADDYDYGGRFRDEPGQPVPSPAQSDARSALMPTPVSEDQNETAAPDPAPHQKGPRR